MSFKHCLLSCCCCCCRFWKALFLAIANAGNFIAFLGTVASAAFPFWTEYRLVETEADAIDPILTGKVLYGVIFAIAELDINSDTTVAEAYDDPNILVNLTRAFVALMLIFQIAIFILYYIKPSGWVERCLPRTELAVQTLVVVFGLFATLCGVVALLSWFFLSRNNTEDLIQGATFGGLIVPMGVRVDTNDLRFGYFALLAATALELIATIFVFTTCTLFCAREVPDEEKPLKDDMGEDDDTIDEADTAPETVEEDLDEDDGEEVEEEEDEDDGEDDEDEEDEVPPEEEPVAEEPAEEAVEEEPEAAAEETEEPAAEEAIEEEPAAEIEAATAAEEAATEEAAPETAEAAAEDAEVDTPISPPEEEIEVTQETLASGPKGPSMRSASIKI